MGVLGGLGGLGGMHWLLPAGATLLPAQAGPSLGGDLLHYSVPSALAFSDYSADTAVLSTRDRFRIARARTASLVRDWGPYSLAIIGSRARSEHDAADRIDRRDGFATYQFGATTRTDLPGGFTLRAAGTFTYMSRRLGPLDFDGRPRHGFIADSGFSLERGGADRLTLSFIAVAPASSRTELARMAELIGGSPRAERGLRLAFTHRVEAARSGALTWGIDASAMRLSQQDSLLLGAPARTTEQRLTLNLTRRF